MLKKGIYLILVSVTGAVLPLAGAGLLVWRLSFHLGTSATRLQKVLFSFLVFLVGNALIYEVFNLLGIRPPISVIGLLYALIGIYIGWRYKPIADRSSGLISRGDIVSLAAAFIAFIFVLFPIYYSGTQGETHAESTLHMLTNGEDNASHFALYKFAYIHDGYAYSAQVNDKGLISTLTDYPQGSEFTTSWLVKSVLGNKIVSNNARLVETYFLSFGAIFSFMVFLICSSSLSLYGNGRMKITYLQSSALLALSFILITIGPLLSLLARGFLSQIFAFIFLLGLVLALFEHRLNKNSQNIFIFALMMWAGVTISWWFLSPLATIIIIATYYKDPLVRKPLNLLLAATIFILSIYPIMLGLFASTGSGYLTQEGGIDKPSIAMVIFFFFFGSLAIARARAAHKSRLIIILMGSSLLFSLAVGVYQKILAGHLSYYFYKSCYTVFLIGAVGALYSGLLLFGRVNFRRHIQADLEFSGVLILTTVAGLLIWKPVYPRVYAHDWFNNLITPSSMGTLLHDSSTGKFKDYLFIGGCNAPARYISNRWSGALMLSEGSKRNAFDLASLFGNESELLASLQTLDNSQVYVYISRPCIGSKTFDYLSGLTTSRYTFTQ